MNAIASAGWKKAWKISVFSVITANSVDIHSSIGGIEGNPFLRGPGGTFSTKKAIVIKSGLMGALLLFQAFRLRKYPEEVKPYTIINTAITGINFGVAVRNYGIRK